MSTELTESEQQRRQLVAEKHAQAKQLLRETGIDCWLTFQREGSDNLLPFLIGGDYLVSQSALMVFADGPTVAIVADYDGTQVEGLYDEVHTYPLDWKEPLLTTLRERNPARIGLNYDLHNEGIDGLTHGQYRLLTETIAPLGMEDRLMSASPVTSLVRAVKTTSEVERMTRACEMTQRIFDDLTGVLRPGLSEYDIFEIIGERMQTYGVGPSWEASYCPSVTSSKRSAGHTAPGTTVIGAGEGVRVDFGVLYEGYASDMMRTWYLKKPGETAAPPEFQRPFDVVKGAIAAAAEAIRPGATGREVDTAARSVVEAAGYKYTHATGHQVGKKAHDGGLILGPDNVRYGDRSGGTIVEGMVFTLEPVFDPIGLEDNVVVTSDGCRFLVPTQTDLYLV